MSDEIRFVLVKPGDVLLIGNLGEVTYALAEAIAQFKEQVGLTHVAVFSADIDISAVSTEQLTPALDAPVRHGTDDCYPYGGDYDAGRDYIITCYCGVELTGETDGSVEAELEGHIAREEAAPE